MRRVRVEPAPAVCAVLLCAGLGAQWFAQDEVVLPAVVAPPRQAMTSANLQPPAAPGGLLRHPLFAPGRSAAAPAAAEGRAAANGEVTLVGTAIARGTADALLKSGASVESVRVGRTAFGWRVVAVRPGRAALARDGVTRSLTVGQSTAPEGTR